ncbi:TetR family transcriptional regulator [Nocardioides silvaticus]|uniref:TetR family transcriptional regulator n=1 Tax=Nocardioides silvaticus TaxID=2201891 RepID=A0A316TFB5_9ACTN|nr:TetR family transcriptional regulator [Nocardioides silvaticus]
MNRDAIVATAAELADGHGLRQVSLSAVARAVGVRVPSLYSHLQGTTDLMAGLTALALTELADRGDRALAGRSGRDALVALADVHRNYAREHPGRFEAAGALDVPVTDVLQAAGARVAEQTAAVLRGYPVSEEEQVHAVRLVASVLRGFVELEAGGAFGHRRPSSGESWTRVIDALDGTLRSWSSIGPT